MVRTEVSTGYLDVTLSAKSLTFADRDGEIEPKTLPLAAAYRMAIIIDREEDRVSLRVWQRGEYEPVGMVSFPTDKADFVMEAFGLMAEQVNAKKQEE